MVGIEPSCLRDCEGYAVDEHQVGEGVAIRLDDRGTRRAYVGDQVAIGVHVDARRDVGGDADGGLIRVQ